MWGPIDGAGAPIGFAAVCRNLVTKEIVGFAIVLDDAETWSTSGAQSAMDVENVASHEFGHAAGLGHVNSPRDGCLSMFRFIADGEIQKRTLGLGDKLRMNALYGSLNPTGQSTVSDGGNVPFGLGP